MSIKLTLPYPPSVNRMYRNQRGITVKSQEAKAYAWQVTSAANEQGATCFDGNVSVSIRVYRPRKSGDLDNRAKCVLDCLQGVAYSNDSQIVELHMYRYDDKKNPRVEVEVKAA